MTNKMRSHNSRSARSSQSITLSDVAKAAGVSIITVSRALNKPELVSDKTLARVKAVVDELGYVPNLLAGNLKSNRSRLIVVLLPTIAGSPFLRSVQVLMDYVTEAGYQVMLGQTGYDNSHQEQLLDIIIGRRPDGVVITGRITSEAAKRKLQVAGIPVVEVWEMGTDPLDMMVGFSHYAVGEAVAEYLWSRNRRKFALAVGHDVRGRQRATGFKRRIRELYEDYGGQEPIVHTYSVQVPGTVASGRETLARIIAEQVDVDTVVCSSDSVAVGVLYEAQAKGIEVPHRLAVMGYGDMEIAPYTVPALTTVKINDEEIGLQAAKMLISRAEGEATIEPVVDIGFSIVERDTV